MYNNIFSAQSVQDLLAVLPSLPQAIWETFYVTVVSTALSLVLGLPLGVLLVAGEKGGVLPLPRWLMQVINVVINLLRSIPFLILMIMVFPLSRLLIGTAVGTTATIVPLVAAAFPFVARLVESSLREVDGNIIEAAQSMGATPMQIICKVLIPESVPSLIQNVTIALTTILGYSAMSGIIGGGGLGKIAIDYGYYRYKYLVMLVAVILLVLLVQVLQTIGTKLAIRCDKRLKKYYRKGGFGLPFLLQKGKFSLALWCSLWQNRRQEGDIKGDIKWTYIAIRTPWTRRSCGPTSRTSVRSWRPWMRMSRRTRPARNLWTGPRSMKPWRIWSMKS